MTDTDELQIMNTLIDDFNRRSGSDPDFRSQVAAFNKLMSFTIKDTANTYTIRLAGGQAHPVQQGASLTKPDIQMTCSLKHLMGILMGDIPPAAAVLNPRIRILGSPTDLAFIKKFILKESEHLRELAKTIDF